MQRTRIQLSVYVDLDPMPGAFHSAESAQNIVRGILCSHLEHYNPRVSFERHISFHEHSDQAIRVSADMLEPGGRFFMNDQAVVGWYYIKSDDPQKRDLVLPAHIFNKCFRFVNDENPVAFRFVEEIV